MAFVNDILKSEAGLVDRATAYFKTLWADRQARLRKDRVYRDTLNELQGLSRRDLADIGLHVSQLETIAHEAAYGT